MSSKESLTTWLGFISGQSRDARIQILDGTYLSLTVDRSGLAIRKID